MRCQRLAAAVGLGGKTWHAYLSVEHGTNGDGGMGAVNARERIGAGPWYNVRGLLVAQDLASLHARKGDPTIFIDEHGVMINGQWTGAPTPLEHDVLTGTNADGTLATGKTCSDWTSSVGPPDGGVPRWRGAPTAVSSSRASATPTASARTARRRPRHPTT